MWGNDESDTRGKFVRVHVPGNVLIIDDIATNRIVMKVRLTAASYRVIQATGGAEGLAAARRHMPDLILCSAQIADLAPAAFARALRSDPATRSIPLVFEALRRDAAAHYALLEAGADDILLKPHDEQLLLARLRSLLRMKETAEELTLREGASRALGLAEEPEEFLAAGRIAVITAEPGAGSLWPDRLTAGFAHRLSLLPFRDAMREIDDAAAPDAVAIEISPKTAAAGLQYISDLRARADTRDCGILVLIHGAGAGKFAAEALDRGASDVIVEGFSPREIALRLERQVRRKRMLERLRSDMRNGLRAALTDPLTGLYNRRHALPRLAAIAENAARSGGDFAAMILDIDHFKPINDRFGHGAGDAVLVQLAEVLRAGIGPADLLARIGGEEFLLVLPEADRKAAEFTARRLCRTIRDTAFRISGRAAPLSLTVSIGVAMGSDCTAASGHGEPAPLHDAVLSQADKALYAAKAHGRNQVIFCAIRSAA